MNKEEAAKEVGISVRTLQRAMKDEKISYSYQRSKANGKQEVVFSEDDIASYKKTLEYKEEKPATALMTRPDTDLARSVVIATKEILEFNYGLSKPGHSVAVEAKLLLKLDEAALLTGLSKKILRNAIEEKKLKAQMIGKAFRIKRADLDAYIKNL
jgi:excisionase family DNA binding protein